MKLPGRVVMSRHGRTFQARPSRVDRMTEKKTPRRPKDLHDALKRVNDAAGFDDEPEEPRKG